MGVILPGVERDFPPVFSWDWDGKRLKFVMHFGNRFKVQGSRFKVLYYSSHTQSYKYNQ